MATIDDFRPPFDEEVELTPCFNEFRCRPFVDAANFLESVVPGFLTNLVSVSRLREKGVYWRSDNFTLRMTKTEAEIGICKLV